MQAAHRLAGCLAGWLLAALPLSAGRLDRAVVERLDNGLTVMVLDDPTLPIVSVQALYRAGGRSECTGATGLAHFVEHMAYRATERFPDTNVVSRLYAVGGEWHGYTWIDETTYFETVPKEHLPLVLDIEADRMARLLLPEKELEAERGAVLTELHGYENDPASRLYDAVAAVSFTEHPYRQNVIGWTSDVERITHADVEGFYRRYYQPGNAVLAIAGDVRTAEALSLVRSAFAGIPGGEAPPLPVTVEPPQEGVRRVDLAGGGGSAWFQISYRAPAATDPDYPAFLVIQALLSGSTGASFRQDGDPIPARPGTRLDGIGEDIATVFAPTAQPYLFSIEGKAALMDLEPTIEERIAALRDRLVPAGELDRVRKDLATELVLDVETPEDAAHQMAFFEGIGAFGVLKRLPELIAAVTPEDVRRAAAAWLQPHQRTIGWVHPGPAPAAVAERALRPLPADPPAPPPPVRTSASAPRMKTLPNGVTLIVRRLPRAPVGYLRAVVPGEPLAFGDTAAKVETGEPSWRHTSLGLAFRSGELARAAAEVRRSLDAAAPEPLEESDDPEVRLDRALRDGLGIAGPALTPDPSPASPTPSPGEGRHLPSKSPHPLEVERAEVPPSPREGDGEVGEGGQGGEGSGGGPVTPITVVAVGDLDEEEALRILEKAFAGLPRRQPLPELVPQAKQSETRIALPGKAQSQIGYAVPAPPAQALAWRMLLYIVAHDYEGRLGKELIARRGLLYYIGTGWRSDGRHGWLFLNAGVSPERLDETLPLFFGLIEALREHPPTEEEIEEARQYLIGRRLTAPMSDEEITAAYAREWIERRRLLTGAEWEREVRAVTREDVLAILPAFLAGARAVVDVRSRPASGEVGGRVPRHDPPTTPDRTARALPRPCSSPDPCPRSLRGPRGHSRR